MLAWSLVVMMSQVGNPVTTTALPPIQFASPQLCDQAARDIKAQWMLYGQRYILAICVRTQ